MSSSAMEKTCLEKHRIIATKRAFEVSIFQNFDDLDTHKITITSTQV
jgi:hypothetical protein